MFLRLCFLFLSVPVILSSATLPADSVKPKAIGVVVKIDLLALANDLGRYEHKHAFILLKSNYYSATVEKLLPRNNSVQLSFLLSPVNRSYGNKWWALIPEYKYFVGRREHRGYYFGANLKLIGYSERNSNVIPQTWNDPAVQYGSYSNLSIGLGFINGIQFYLWKRITIDLIAGMGMYTTVSEKTYQPQYLWRFANAYGFSLGNDIDVRLGFNLGYRF